MSQSEWLILACLGITALLWMAEDVLKIKSHIAAMIGLSLLFIPGLFKFKWKELQDRTIWGTFLLLGGALSMSAAMASSGLAAVAGRLHPPARLGKAWWVVLLIMMVGTHFIRLGMLSNVAAVALFAPILIALAPKLGLHPVAFTHAGRRHRYLRLHPADADHGGGHRVLERHFHHGRLREGGLGVGAAGDRLRHPRSWRRGTPSSASRSGIRRRPGRSPSTERAGHAMSGLVRPHGSAVLAPRLLDGEERQWEAKRAAGHAARRAALARAGRPADARHRRLHAARGLHDARRLEKRVRGLSPRQRPVLAGPDHAVHRRSDRSLARSGHRDRPGGTRRAEPLATMRIVEKYAIDKALRVQDRVPHHRRRRIRACAW